MANEFPAKVRELLAVQNKNTVTYIISPSGDGDTFKFNSDDLNTETKELTNAMTVGTIEEGHNEYKVSTERTEIKLTNESGIPLPISDEAPGGDGNAFLQRQAVGLGQKGGKSYFISLSDSGDLDVKVIKGKAIAADDKTKPYNELLAELNRDDNTNSLIKRSTNLLQAGKNTYYTGRRFLPETGIPENDSNVGVNLIQSTLGSYKKLNRGTQSDVGEPSDVGVFEINQSIMQSLGSQVTLKSSGEYYVPKNTRNEGEILLAQAAALAPGLARLGLPVPFSSLRASNVLKETNPNFPNIAAPSLEGEDDIESNGSMYNWLVVFDGFQTQFTLPAIGIQLGAIAAIISLAAQVYRSEDAGYIRAGFLTYFNIKTNGNPQDGIIFATAIAEAVALGAAQAVPGVSFFVSSPLAEGTGWYTTVLRKITKIILNSTYGAAINLAGNFESNSLVGTLESTINGISNVAYGFGLDDLLETFKNIGIITARTYGSMNGMPTYQNGFNTGRDAYKPSNRGYIDSINDNMEGEENRINVAALIKKDRLKNGYNLGTYNGKYANAWGTSTTPSMYLMPTNLKLAGQIINSGAPSTSLQRLSDVNAVDSDTGRLSPESVRELENRLASSYMPFYFHDLRTNEIVSFHAFLESTKDGFQAEWNSNSSYGRVEPVHTYKGTTRDISVSFFVVATNPKDHDIMWWKINKLVTMVYPQFTRGRSLTTNEGKTFIQPFSQIPGGSPIIRLRLGDVWKSNYSKFNVARLFGLGQTDFNVDPENRALSSTATYQRIREEIITYRDSLIEQLSSADFVEGNEFVVTIDSGGIAGSIGNYSLVFGTDSSVETFAEYGATVSATRLLRAVRGLPDGTYDCRVTQILKNVSENKLYSEYKVRLLGMSAAAINASGTDEFIIRFRSPRYTQEAVDLLINDDGGVGGSLGFGIIGNSFGSITVTQEDLQIYESCGGLQWRYSDAYLELKLQERVDQLANEGGRDQSAIEREQRLAEIVRSFFNSDAESPDPNPIMQAFESTAGKGMAVAFKGVDIDWGGSTWETTWAPDRPYSRAPMWLKISMNGTVIHDIVPGLDSDGFTRAAAYQVGKYSNATNNVYIVDYNEERANIAETSAGSATSLDTERDAPAGAPLSTTLG